MTIPKSVKMSVLILLLACGYVQAQDLVVYPADGQSQEQMEKDKYECYGWAKQQSGFDPMAQPQATTPPPPQQTQRGGVVRGGVGGAAVGAVVGGIVRRDPRRGAATGAVTGAIVGGAHQQSQANQQRQAEQQWAEQQAATYAKNRDGYNRAFGACLEGRKYSVK